jgi:hypothetical protein
VNGRFALLLLLMLAHGLVDTFASFIQPLWPVMTPEPGHRRIPAVLATQPR